MGQTIQYLYMNKETTSSDENQRLDVRYNNRRLSKTINFSHWLEGLQSGHCSPGKDQRYFEMCKRAGFSAVRLPVEWVAHVSETAPYTLDQEFLTLVDSAVEKALSLDLALVLTNALDQELMTEPAKYKDRLLSITRQVATHYQSSPAQVFFEPMSEPHDKLDPLWNEYLRETISVIRESNPDRAVIIGPSSYNNFMHLAELSLPEQDQNLIVTLHQYYPIEFTMQGEEWLERYDKSLSPRSWVGTKFECTDDERKEFEYGYELVKKWSEKTGRPIFIGEFGASEHADIRSRINWTRLNRKLAEERGFSWGYWSFAKSFGLYDVQNDQWNHELLSALMS
jgi:endoglucanase